MWVAGDRDVTREPFPAPRAHISAWPRGPPLPIPRDRFSPSRKDGKFRDLGGPRRGDGFLDASKDDVRGHRVEFHVTAGWEDREALSDPLLQFLPCAAEECAEASVEAELFAVVAYEVEDCANVAVGNGSSR